MTVREVNALTRDGGTGTNVYIITGSTHMRRVIRARTRDGIMQVRLVLTGRWMDVPANTRWKIG